MYCSSTRDTYGHHTVLHNTWDDAHCRASIGKYTVVQILCELTRNGIFLCSRDRSVCSPVPIKTGTLQRKIQSSVPVQKGTVQMWISYFRSRVNSYRVISVMPVLFRNRIVNLYFRGTKCFPNTAIKKGLCGLGIQRVIRRCVSIFPISASGRGKVVGMFEDFSVIPPHLTLKKDPPHLTLRGQAGSRYSRIRIQRQLAPPE